MKRQHLVSKTPAWITLSLIALLLSGPLTRGQIPDDTSDPVLNATGIPKGYVLVEGDMLIPEGAVAAGYQINLWPQGNPTVVPFMFDMTNSNCGCSTAQQTCIGASPCPGICNNNCPTTCTSCVPGPCLGANPCPMACNGNCPTSQTFATNTCDAVSPANQNVMLAAMAQWEAVADIDFRQCPNNQCTGNFILVRDSSRDCNPRNSSPVGMQGGTGQCQNIIGAQCLNITSWGSQGIIVHELGHALGLIHEHSRADRNNFITYNASNIQAGTGGQFAVRSMGGEYGPYDFDSIMHYSVCAFSSCCPLGSTCPCPSNCQTITILEPYATNCTTSKSVFCPGMTVGQRAYVSQWDGLVMSFLYPQDNWRFLDDECGDRGVECELPLIGGCVIMAGTFFCPFVDDLLDSVDQTPEGGTLWILSNGTSYGTGGTLSKAMTIRAPLGATLIP